MAGILFIDSRVADLEQLLAGLAEDLRVVVLDPVEDGLVQIAAALDGLSGLDSIHIISHGSSGTLELGSSILTAYNLDEYSIELERIGASLSDSGDILLYGCEVGAGPTGERFIESLAAHTGADVAASSDLTGPALLGGDWALEVSSGTIEAPVALSAEARLDYAHALSAPYLTPAGMLDPTFDGDGVVLTAWSGTSLGYGSALQPDGKIVAGALTGSYVLNLARYEPDGSLDNTFDGDGRVEAVLGVVSVIAGSRAVAVQPDGKIVAVGCSGSDIAIARFNPDGSPDIQFDGDGKVVTDFFGATNVASGVALQSDGKIVVAGWTFGPEPTGALSKFALARYQPDGSLDTSFDFDGKVVTGFPLLVSRIAAIAVQPDGKIVAAGTAYYDAHVSSFALVRYNEDGSLDTSFGTGGTVLTDLSGREDLAVDVALQADGKILVAGRSDYTSSPDFALVRYNGDGSLDPTFGGDGKVVTEFHPGALDYASSVTVQPDGKIVVAGSSSVSSGSFALARYNQDGSLDTRFDGDGTVTIPFGHATSVALQPDGSIVVTGSYALASGPSSAVLRLMGGGLSDHTVIAGSAFALTVPGALFTDPDGGSLAYAAGLEGGASLPAWLSFDPATRTLSGTPPAGEFAAYAVEVTTTDAEGLSASDRFQLCVGPAGWLLGTSTDDWIPAGGASESIAGFMGNDSVAAGNGDDWVHGNQGDDTICGSLGNDDLRGGQGDDLLQGNQGNDTLYGSLGNDDLRGGNDADLIQGNQGNDTIYGSLGNDDLRGGKDDDLLRGGEGYDTLYGSLGQDTLSAGPGNDTVIGGDGDDVLQGRLGNDLLDGGAGADRFWFNSYGAANADLIVDFESGVDQLQFDPSVFTGQLVYLPSSGQLYYDPDGLGVGVDAELVATLGVDTHPELQGIDFLFA